MGKRLERLQRCTTVKVMTRAEARAEAAKMRMYWPYAHAEQLLISDEQGNTVAVWGVRVDRGGLGDDSGRWLNRDGYVW